MGCWLCVCWVFVCGQRTTTGGDGWWRCMDNGHVYAHTNARTHTHTHTHNRLPGAEHLRDCPTLTDMLKKQVRASQRSIRINPFWI
jgi:hypothetical protein